MKKLVPYIILISLGCAFYFILSKDIKSDSIKGKAQNRLPFCTRLEKIKIKGRKPAFAPNYDLQWSNHTTLFVYFIDGDKLTQDQTISIASTWSRYCSIAFRDTDKITESQIRITFESGGYASAVGLESSQEDYADEPTMFLEGLDTLNDQNEFRRIVLHEFGHALGLEHELSKPSAKIPWDTNAVYKYYLTEYGWKEQTVYSNIFLPFNVPKEYEEFDSNSIMIYAIPNELTIGDYSISWPEGLSFSDTFYINKWYPKF